MLVVRSRFFVAMLGMVLTVPAIADAHRVDEYLQATRIDVSLGRVELEIDLTAGVDVAPAVWGMIDADRDGRISAVEGRRYAALVLKAVLLQVDDRPRPVALISSRFPSLNEINSGAGPIRIKARATLPRAKAGRHTLHYENMHRRAMSVYLVNVLVPSNRAITIASQLRDTRQTEMVMTYDVAAPVARRSP
jgi:hypothetical protein